MVPGVGRGGRPAHARAAIGVLAAVVHAVHVAGDVGLDVLDGGDEPAHVLGAVLVGAGDGAGDGVDHHQRDRRAFLGGGGDGGAD